jgi:hypothetical protein
VPRAGKPFFIPMVHSLLEAVGDVVAPELSPRGSRARSHETRESAEAHLNREARSEAEEHMATPELFSARRRGPGPRDTWRRRNPPLQGGVVRNYSVCGSAWMHALLLVLTESLYVGVPGLQGTDSGPRAHLGRGYEPADGANSSTCSSVILNFFT